MQLPCSDRGQRGIHVATCNVERRGASHRIEAPAAQLYTSTGWPAGQPERAWAFSRHVLRVHGRYKYRLYISYLNIDGFAPIISGVAVAWCHHARTWVARRRTPPYVPNPR